MREETHRLFRRASVSSVTFCQINLIILAFFIYLFIFMKAQDCKNMLKAGFSDLLFNFNKVRFQECCSN